MKFRILDHVSESGDPHNTALNDDAFGFGIDDRVAIVADGATGLSETSYIRDRVSDARWIAEFIVEQVIHALADYPIRDLVAAAIEGARQTVSKERHVESIPRYAWPSTSFIAARLQKDLLEISGLGDCVAYIQMDDGYIERFSALAENSHQEANAARKDLARRRIPGGAVGNPAIRTPEVLASLRAKREENNTPESGVWTVSLEPEAADHIMTVALPVAEVRCVLLASDGFSAAFDRYEIVDPAAVLSGSSEKPLSDLQNEIRQIEREIDPLCERFPRYKQSDDSTAILLEIANWASSAESAAQKECKPD